MSLEHDLWEGQLEQKGTLTLMEGKENLGKSQDELVGSGSIKEPLFCFQ